MQIRGLRIMNALLHAGSAIGCEIGIDLVEGCHQGGKYRRLRLRSAQDDAKERCRILIEGDVEGGARREIERAFADVADDTDDLHDAGSGRAAIVDALTDGVLSCEVLLRERLVDDDDIRLVSIFVLCEVIATE